MLRSNLVPWKFHEVWWCSTASTTLLLDITPTVAVQGSKFAMRIRTIAKNCESEANSLRFASQKCEISSLRFRFAISAKISQKIALFRKILEAVFLRKHKNYGALFSGVGLRYFRSVNWRWLRVTLCVLFKLLVEIGSFGGGVVTSYIQSSQYLGYINGVSRIT